MLYIDYVDRRIHKESIFAFFGASLELISIVSLAILMKMAVAKSNFYVIHNFNIGIEVIAVCVPALYLLKSMLSTYLLDRQLKLSYSTQDDLMSKLIGLYIENINIRMNTGEMIRNISYEVSLYCHSYVLPKMTLIAEGMSIISLFALLFIYNAWMAVFIFTIGCATYLAYKLKIMPKIYEQGEQRKAKDAQAMQLIQEAIRAKKELSSYSVGSLFSDKLKQISYASSQIALRNNLIMNLPRLWLDTLIIMMGVLVLIVNYYVGRSIEDSIDFVVIFGLAAFRMMPSTMRLLSSWQSMKYSKPVLNVFSEIQKEICFEEKINLRKNIKFNKIQINNINIERGDKKILKNQCMEINRSELILVTGNSGAGKTSLIDYIFESSIDKEIYVDGQKINLLTDVISVVYVPQKPYIFNDTLEFNITLSMSNRDGDNLLDLLSLVGLSDFNKSMIIKDASSNISGGQMQRIALARALFRSPDLLILDESTNALDKNSQKEILKGIKDKYKDMAIIMITHDFELKLISDKEYHLKDQILIQR
jgi:ABC-type bacteriocin/lantibiotic exporter with double-glycine peptidase domain